MNAQPIRRPRKEWADVAKGLAIIAVIAGHMGEPSVDRAVYLWHLPVFFLIAGYFFRPAPAPAFLKAKARRLLAPYYATCAALCLLALIAQALSIARHEHLVRTWVVASLYAAGGNVARPIQVPGIGAIWFLWALFFSLIILNGLIEKKWGIPAIIAIAVLGWASFQYTRIWLPLSIQAGMLCSLYLLIGYELKRFGFEPDAVHPVLLIACGLAAAWGIGHFRGFWLVHNEMGNGWIDFFVSIGASIVILAVSAWVARHTRFVKAVLIFYGTNSLLILCLHVIELSAIHVERAIPIFSELLGIQGFSANSRYGLALAFACKLICVTIGAAVIRRIPLVNKIFSPR